MNFFSKKHPIWLVGFRPFFIMAICYSAILPILWWAVFSGQVMLPGAIKPLQWHAHEMLFGFGGAILIGFLLTASKNWVGIRGIHGLPLMILSVLWIFERLIIYIFSQPLSLIGHLVLSLFFLLSIAYLVQSLFFNRQNDSFKDNFYFYPLLFFALVAKNLILTEKYYLIGLSMAVGIFRLAFAVMFERTMTQFMKGTEGIVLYRSQLFDGAIKILVGLTIFQGLFPANISIIILILTGTLLLIRWWVWRPLIGFKKFGNATMYIGYLGLIIHFYFEALRVGGMSIGVGSISLHTFTFLTMGIVIPSMIVRISQGHTGRKPEFQFIDRIAISCVLIAAVFRLLFVTYLPSQFNLWILIATLLWFSAFLLLAIRFIPMLIRPRIDGKEH